MIKAKTIQWSILNVYKEQAWLDLNKTSDKRWLNSLSLCFLLFRIVSSLVVFLIDTQDDFINNLFEQWKWDIDVTDIQEKIFIIFLIIYCLFSIIEGFSINWYVGIIFSILAIVSNNAWFGHIKISTTVFIPIFPTFFLSIFFSTFLSLRIAKFLVYNRTYQLFCVIFAPFIMFWVSIYFFKHPCYG